jgi:ADP-heptose:LPS heptosyltransferase
MKLIMPTRKFTIEVDKTPIDMVPNKKYLCPNFFVENVFENNQMLQSIVRISNFINGKELVEHVDFTNKRLFISRTGGVGDFFFILRSVKQIKDKYKGVHVTFACAIRYMSIVKCLFTGLVDDVISIPYTIAPYERCDYYFTFEDYIENNPDAKHINAFELMSRRFHVDIEGSHSMPIHLYSKYYDQAKKVTEDWNIEIDPTTLQKKLIGLQLTATAILRSYPIQYIAILIKRFYELGYKVLLLEKRKTIEEIYERPEMKDVRVLLPYNRDVEGSFELSVALAKECSLIIAPDSVFTYIADSLNVPVITLYSPFTSKLRAKNLNVYAIDVFEGCINCCKHSDMPCSYSNDMDGYSPCMKAIKPDFVSVLAQKILNGKI